MHTLATTRPSPGLDQIAIWKLKEAMCCLPYKQISLKTQLVVALMLSLFLVYHNLSQTLFQTSIFTCLSFSRSFASSLSHTRHSSSISTFPVQMSASTEGTYRVLCHTFHATKSTTKYPTPK